MFTNALQKKSQVCLSKQEIPGPSGGIQKPRGSQGEGVKKVPEKTHSLIQKEPCGGRGCQKIPKIEPSSFCMLLSTVVASFKEKRFQNYAK